MCRDAKRRYIHSSLDSLSQAQTWKFLMSLGVGKTTNTAIGIVDLNSLNKHFSTAPVTLDDATKFTPLSYLSHLAPPDCSPFNFQSVADEDVKKSILSISTKAVGEDNISLNMLTPVLSDIVPVITHIINFSLMVNVFPTAWKKAFVIPLPKTSNPTCLSHFRPISILPVLSKVLESIAHKQLYSFLVTNDLLCPFQSGFRPSHSTVSALLNVTEDIRLAMDNTKLTIVTLLDFSSAFNSVDFDILLASLRSINISSSAIDWFHSYLHGRQQCVKANDDSSEWSNLTAGVPQGGVLSPLLFSIFINNISRVISSSYHLYADDLQIYRHFSLLEVSQAIEAVNKDLESVQTWAKTFGLLVNPSKSQALIIGSSRLRCRLDPASIPLVYYDGICIPYTDKAKNLGVIFDCHLSWLSHINEVSKRMHYSFHSLKRLQNFLPLKTKIMLAQALLLPILDYADVCYLDATEELLNKLERLQNLAIRFIFGLRKFDHVSEFRAQLKWLPIRLRRDVHILSTLYNILHNPATPDYLRSRFHFLPPDPRPRRDCITKVLECPRANTRFLFNSFSVKAAQLWNDLPKTVQESPSISVFKKRVKEHFISQQP
ncbi:hypothetical protein O0L34_g4803 [Tuta absoluta]|nr:hypothetical protein O0L34_g4803 [Tuta absoluta]